MYPKDSVHRVFCDKPRYTRGIPRPTAFQTRVISLIYHGFILKPSGKLERTLVQRIRSDFLIDQWFIPVRAGMTRTGKILDSKSWTRSDREGIVEDQGQMGQTFRTKKRKLRTVWFPIWHWWGKQFVDPWHRVQTGEFKHFPSLAKSVPTLNFNINNSY